MYLNTDFYKKKEDKISEKEENIISKYIENMQKINYEDFFSDEITSQEIYNLSSIGQNILNWYPFENTDVVLEIGGNFGNLTELLTRKCKKVVTIEPNLIKAKAISKRCEKIDNLEIITGSFDNIELDRKFDYIVLIGVIPRIEEIMGRDMKLDKMIQELERFLLEDGKFLIAVDNKFGLRYFAGNPENILNKKFESLIGYSNESKKIETFTKSRVERKLGEIGYNTNFYYPLPDYKIPNVIFSDKQLPRYNDIDKYYPYYLDNSTIIFNEIDVFREILKNDEKMFTFFTNSFFVEASKKTETIKYKYISFNNLRKQKYRLITKITDEYVEKEVVNNLADNHYENIKKNIKQLQKQNIRTLDYEKQGKFRVKYKTKIFAKQCNNKSTRRRKSGKSRKYNKVIH